jgi:hypothetical protein
MKITYPMSDEQLQTLRERREQDFQEHLDDWNSSTFDNPVFLRQREYANSRVARERNNWTTEDIIHHLKVHPIDRLAGLINEWMPGARQEWHDRDEYWVEGYQPYPYLLAMKQLIEKGDALNALRALNRMNSDLGELTQETLDLRTDYWADVHP